MQTIFINAYGRLRNHQLNIQLSLFSKVHLQRKQLKIQQNVRSAAFLLQCLFEKKQGLSETDNLIYECMSLGPSKALP